MNFVEIKTAHEYIDLVSKYSWLVDGELQKIETFLKNKPEESGDIINTIPKLISLVNVIGYLRGQDGAFSKIRPTDVIKYQGDLYKNEDAFEARLAAIIRIICKEQKNREKYEWCLTNYFLKARLPKDDQ